METQTRDEFKQEWLLLQTQCEQSERFALLIKLVCIVTTVFMVLYGANIVATVAVVLIFWLQEAIWKTFQSRTEARLINIESLLNNKDASASSVKAPFQFNLEFQLSRPGMLGLIISYLKQALRPTIAYPYAVLVIISLILG